MATYAAVVSLMNNMEQIMNHPRLSTSLDKYQIESLGEKLGFFLDFIERYNCYGGSKEAEDLESQIATAAHAAEDIIESHIVDQIRARSIKKSLSCLLHLQKVIADMDSIKEKVMEVKEKWGFREEQPTYTTPATSSRPLTTGKNTMVGFGDELSQLKDLLTRQQADRKIISIVGMGGMGKTTLARNVYEDFVIMRYFDIRAWATISQEYSVREILLELLSCQGKSAKEILLKPLSCQEKSDKEIVDELGEQLYKSLLGRRYLIILDDMWSIEVWDKIKFFFPNSGDRSRVVLTTRLSNVVIHCGSSSFRMNFLDEDKSWKLFCEKVFEHEDCPPELEKVGKEIVKLCKGLPLSVAVIGGLLRKSHRTIRYWQYVAENINSILISGEEQCLNVLSLSYSHLPAHLRPCFLYMRTFPEDCEIRVSKIIKLWVAEGFLRSNGDQMLEEIAEGNLKDLIDRNLILIGKCRKNGKIRSCRIHDLLRDLCFRIAEKEKFFCVLRTPIPRGIDRERRLLYHDYMEKDRLPVDIFLALPSATLVRSLIWGHRGMSTVVSRLLRVLDTANVFSEEETFRGFNLRFLTFEHYFFMFRLPSSISLIWNLQTLIIRSIPVPNHVIVAPLEIWKMPRLRHLECRRIYLPEPPTSDDQQDEFVGLGNLQTLTKVVNFKWSEEACKRIPNIKKLHMEYAHLEGYDDCLHSYLYNFSRLHKLESLKMEFYFLEPLPYRDILLKNHLAFPSSLNKLSLTNSALHWEDLTMIGSLPQLEVLKLEGNSVVGGKWSPVDGEFLRLKFLKINSYDLISWTAESSHFPILEKLVLEGLKILDEIPSGIGEIPTLELIRLEFCSESAVISAMKIKDEQDSFGDNSLQIQVKISGLSESFRERVEMESLSINNIQLEKAW